MLIQASKQSDELALASPDLKHRAGKDFVSVLFVPSPVRFAGYPGSADGWSLTVTEFVAGPFVDSVAEFEWSCSFSVADYLGWPDRQIRLSLIRGWSKLGRSQRCEINGDRLFLFP